MTVGNSICEEDKLDLAKQAYGRKQKKKVLN